MKKTVQKNALLIGGLFFLAQSVMAPAASAAGLLADFQPTYLHAATSAAPVIFNGRNSSGSLIKVVENIHEGLVIAGVLGNSADTADADRVIDNSEPTIEEVKNYVLAEIKKAGLNVREAESLVFCESRWDPKAINKMNANGTNDKGLWQINSIHKDISDADKLDYKASTKWAINKRLKDGNWSAWSCANKRVAKSAEPVWE